MLKTRCFSLLVFGLFLANTAYAACTDQFFNGQPPYVAKQSLLKGTEQLCFDEFVVLHSSITKTPLWVAEHLTRQRVIDAQAIERNDVFHAEDRLDAASRAELSDYSRSGYDRGHMAPAADMATLEGQDQSFSLANMVPQNPKLNRGLWAHMEATTRALSMKYGDVYVVTGPAFSTSQLKRLNGRVIVPTETFKAIYIPAANAGAVWWAENSGNGDIYETITLDELTRRTGIDPFADLDKTVKLKKVHLPKPSPKSFKSSASPLDSGDQTRTTHREKKNTPEEPSTMGLFGAAVLHYLFSN